jgi:EmrB/QacA subfamily drug resistance transporter
VIARAAGVTNLPAFRWTFGVAATAAFAFALDRLVVSTALPTIRTDLNAGPGTVEWVVNAYTLGFAVLLLTGAALGDRFGRRRMFRVGITLYTLGSAGAALAPGAIALVTARAIQGVGGAVFLPLGLAMLAGVTPPQRRGAVLGRWGAIGGLGAALGPMVGGVLTDAVGWRAIFWVNVPIGAVLVLAAARLPECVGARRTLDIRGVILSSAALSALVWTLVRATGKPWSDPLQVGGLVAGGVVLVAFVRWEARAASPMLTLTLFRNRTFRTAVTAAIAMYAALFGGLFLIAQFLQIALIGSPLVAGARLLPMAVMPMLVSPLGGLLSDRLGSRTVLLAGLLSEVVGLWWLALAARPGVPYPELVPALVISGAGSGLFFAPVMAAALSGVSANLHAQASGAISAIREFAVVLGVAALGLVFSRRGDVSSPARFLTGFVPAMWVGGGIAAAGVLLVVCVRGRSPRRTRAGAAGIGRCSAGRGDGQRLDGPGERRGRDRQNEPPARVPVGAAHGHPDTHRGV